MLFSEIPATATGGLPLTGSERNATMVCPDGEHICVVFEFITVGKGLSAFLSGSVKGGGLLRCIEEYVRRIFIFK